MTPVIKDHPPFTQGVDHFPIQALGAEPAVEALAITVLPRATRIDIDRADRIKAGFTQNRHFSGACTASRGTTLLPPEETGLFPEKRGEGRNRAINCLLSNTYRRTKSTIQANFGRGTV